MYLSPPLRRRIRCSTACVLAPPEEAAAQAAAEKALAANLLALVGQQGVAHTALRPAGKARLGSGWSRSPPTAASFDPGAKIRVTEIKRWAGDGGRSDG